MNAQIQTKVSSRWVLAICLALLAPGASRADEWYLKIDGVPGMLTEGAFAGWTRVQSVSALVRLTRNPTNDSFGPAAFACEVGKAFDGVSPALLKSCAEGQPYARVSLACVLSQPRPMIYRITLDDVLVAAVHQEGRRVPDTVERETIQFTFTKIEVACLDLDGFRGTAGGLVARFDQTTGAGDLRIRPPFRVTITRQDGRSGVWLTWTAERGHRYALLTRSANGGVWRTTNFLTAAEDGTLSQFLPVDAPDLLMFVGEVD